MRKGRRVTVISDTASKSREINEANVPAEQPASETHTRLSYSHEHGSGSSSVETSAREGSQTAHGSCSTEAAVLIRPDRKLPRSRRIRKRAEYLHLQRTGRRRACRAFVVIVRAAGSDGSRIGITASRRTGGAVVRNRVKRLVREFFRNYRTRLVPEKDVLVIARPEAANLSYNDLKNELGRVLNIDVD
jgi:ribonuclease P protein component